MYRNWRLFWAAHTFGNTSPKNNNTKTTATAFTKNWSALLVSGINWSMRKLERMITAILISVLAIINEPKRIFGSSSKWTILFHGLPCFVFSMLISLKERENNATSDPDTTNERMSSPSIRTPRIVVLLMLASSKMNAKAGLAKGWSKTLVFREKKTGCLACLLN